MTAAERLIEGLDKWWPEGCEYFSVISGIRYFHPNIYGWRLDAETRMDASGTGVVSAVAAAHFRVIANSYVCAQSASSYDCLSCQASDAADFFQSVYAQAVEEAKGEGR